MANRGDFIWEDLLTSNTAAAATFYSKVAGLKTAPSTVNESYITFAGSAGPIGGLMTLPDDAKKTGARPSWMSYISTENVEETARHAESLGGKVLKPPADVGDGGRSAVLQDPQGASFMIYASSHPLEPATTVPLGGIYWHELITTDYKAAFTFYQQLFGWTVANDMNMGDIGVYRIFGTPTMPKGAGGIYNKAPQQPGPPMWLPYIHVASVEKAADVAKSIGAKIMHGPADVPGGRIVIGTDPQGAMFAVHAIVSTATAPKPKAKADRVKRTKKKIAAKKKASPKRKISLKKKTAKKTKRRAGSKK
ncbi:MAG TPA: VOC family protein [Vicinamibacterales bacterium]|nr:VOC family protein [Vicinamibacterales bacterium]